jgi:hypothetical protein
VLSVRSGVFLCAEFHWNGEKEEACNAIGAHHDEIENETYCSIKFVMPFQVQDRQEDSIRPYIFNVWKTCNKVLRISLVLKMLMHQAGREPELL